MLVFGCPHSFGSTKLIHFANTSHKDIPAGTHRFARQTLSIPTGNHCVRSFHIIYFVCYDDQCCADRGTNLPRNGAAEIADHRGDRSMRLFICNVPWDLCNYFDPALLLFLLVMIDVAASCKYRSLSSREVKSSFQSIWRALNIYFSS